MVSQITRLYAAALVCILATSSYAQNAPIEITEVSVDRVTVVQLEGVSMSEDIWTTTPSILDSEGALNVRFGNWVDKLELTSCEVRDSKGQIVVADNVQIEGGVEVQFTFSGLLPGEFTFTAKNALKEASLFFTAEGEVDEEITRNFGEALNVYPNPIRGRQLNIEIGDWIDNRELTAIRITDLFGQPLIDKTMRLEPNVLTRVDVSSLEIGEYILIAVNDRERHTLRFTISR